ncbi:MAG: hypothetical protein AB7S87_12860 [Burkholderiales bacterium]
MNIDSIAAGDLDALRFRIAFSVRYHERRQRWYDWWDRIAKVVALVGGAATVAAVLGPGTPQLWVAAAITVTSALTLVFGFADRARLHFDLKRRYCALEARIIEAGAPDEAAIRKYEAEISLMEGDEPPVLATLVQLCQNEVAQARGQFEDIHPVHPVKAFFSDLFDLPAVAKRR